MSFRSFTERQRDLMYVDFSTGLHPTLPQLTLAQPVKLAVAINFVL